MTSFKYTQIEVTVLEGVYELPLHTAYEVHRNDKEIGHVAYDKNNKEWLAFKPGMKDTGYAFKSRDEAARWLHVASW